MKDSELSLAVARIMWPEHEWEIKGKLVGAFGPYLFDHTTDDALGKMCVWLAKYAEREFGNTIGAELASAIIDAITTSLCADNPHRALAEAIVEAA